MIGPIRGARLPAEIKLQVVRAVHEAATAGMRRRRRSFVKFSTWPRPWMHDMAALTEAGVAAMCQALAGR